MKFKEEKSVNNIVSMQIDSKDDNVNNSIEIFGSNLKENEIEERRVTRSMRKNEELYSIGTSNTENELIVENEQNDVQNQNNDNSLVSDINLSKTEVQNTANKACNDSLKINKDKKCKILNKSKRGRSKYITRRNISNSSNKINNKCNNSNRVSDPNIEQDNQISNDLEIEITSVTLINENSNNTPNSSSSRFAKISWSKFDSYFRRIPMGTRKDIILKTIPTNLMQRRPIVHELTMLEQILFTDPPWGKIGKCSPYLTKTKLSLPPIYLPECSLDSIVDIVSKSILRIRGGSVLKPSTEIQKPYFILFKLPRSLSLVSFEPKSFDEFDVCEDKIDDISNLILDKKDKIADINIEDYCKIENNLNSEPNLNNFNLKNSNEDYKNFHKKDRLDEQNFKWDILNTLDLSYYQFKYIERYLHDVFFNYDQNHKKVFFTPAKINNDQDLLTINIIDRISSNLNEFESFIKDINCEDNSNSNSNNVLDLNSMIDKFRRINNDFYLKKGEIKIDEIPEDYSFLNTPTSISGQPVNFYKDELWTSYRNYDPIYWWIDFILPNINNNLENISDNMEECKVYLHKDKNSYIDAPSCVFIGGLYWLDPSKPIKLTRIIKNKFEYNNERNENEKEFFSKMSDTKELDTVFIHPYMMNTFKDNKDFNFVEANLERFLPIYNEIIDSISRIRLNIQNRIIYENENRIKITDIPFIWMNLVQRYQIVNSWNKLKYFLLNGYKDLYPAFLKQTRNPQSIEENEKNNNSNSDKNNEAPNSKINIHLTNVCSVCFNWETDTLKPFVECVRCGVVSHVACYGVNIPLNELLDFYGWLCDRCELEKKFLGTQYLVAFNPGSTRCILCSHSGGALKKTTIEGEWIHIVCAIWHLPLVVCEDWKNLSNWNIDRLRRSWTNKKSNTKNNDKYISTFGIKKNDIDNKKDLLDIQVNSLNNKLDNIKDFNNEINSIETIENLNNDEINSKSELNKLSELNELNYNTIVNKYDYIKCIFCKNDNTLGLISCIHKFCPNVFHPICAWLNGATIEIDNDPNYSKGEKLIGYIQGWRNVQDEALQLVNIKCYCLSHIKNFDINSQEFREEINLRKKRYVNRDMFPDLYNHKYNQKSSRNSQTGIIQRSRTRSISRSKSWDINNSTIIKKSSCDSFKQNQIYYCGALNVDIYDTNICCICLKYDPTDYPCEIKYLINSNNNNNNNFNLSDQLMSCICCGLTVHWSCYGIYDIKDINEFVCQTCLKGFRHENISCVLCPRRGGALIEAQQINSNNINDKPLFVHIICALYTPGIYLLANGQAYGVNNYIGMTSLVKLKKETNNIKNKSIFIRKFNCIEGYVQQYPFRDIRNEEQFVLEQSNDQDILEIPPVYCCICKSSYGVNISCNQSGCLRTAHPLCLKLYGCCLETIAEIEEINEGIENINDQIIDQIFIQNNKSNNYSSELNDSTNTNDYNEINNNSNILYISPNCPPPPPSNTNINKTPKSNINDNYYIQKVFCPEHGRNISKLNPGGKLLLSTLSSLKIANKIIEDLNYSEKLKKQLFNTQLDILNKENPIFSPHIMNNHHHILKLYWNYYINGILQDSVRIKNGTIYKFKDNSKNNLLIKNNIDVNIFNSRSPKNNQITTNSTPLSTSSLKNNSLKRTRSSGEAIPVPSLEDAIKEARKQREIYKKELMASGVILKKRPPPNRTPLIPFSRLTETELKECALNCLKAINNSSKINRNINIQNVNNNNINNNNNNINSNNDINHINNTNNINSHSTIQTFCIKQHRHDCFRKRLAEYIINPPTVMDHKRKILRSLTRQLRQYGVTAEELMSSDIPLPLTKTKPYLSNIDNNQINSNPVNHESSQNIKN